MKIKNKLLLIFILFAFIVFLNHTKSFCVEYEKPEHIADLPRL